MTSKESDMVAGLDNVLCNLHSLIAGVPMFSDIVNDEVMPLLNLHVSSDGTALSDIVKAEVMLLKCLHVLIIGVANASAIDAVDNIVLINLHVSIIGSANVSARVAVED
mgnify:CR=1 FL=1